MEEKRKHKRLELDVTVELERLDEDGVTTLRYSHVEVVDISRTGIGFKAGQRLEVGIALQHKDSDLDKRDY